MLGLKTDDYRKAVAQTLIGHRDNLNDILKTLNNKLHVNGASGVLETQTNHAATLNTHAASLYDTIGENGAAGAMQQLERITQRFIFAAGSDGACWMKYDVNDSDTGWAGWLTCGGIITDAPRWHCSYDQPGNQFTMNVYARGSNEGTANAPVYHLYWLQVDALSPIYTNPQSGQKFVIKLHDWQSLGGNILY